MAKTPNYTEEQVAQMREMFRGLSEMSDQDISNAVDSLVERFGKNRRSIVAKLSHLKLYRKPERLTKDGKVSETKEKLAQQIASFVGVNPETTALERADKRSLTAIRDYILRTVAE